MESVDGGSPAELEKQLLQIYRDFMTRVTKFDESVAAGNNFLTSFQQGLGFLRRPPLDRRSELFESIIKANETSRLNAYFDAGCFTNNRAKQNLVKLQTCLQGLHKHLNEAKTLLSEMKSFLELATSTIEALNEFSSASYLVNSQEHIADQGEEYASSVSLKLTRMEHIPLMASVYVMMKQDYVMQEKIVSALNMMTPSEELSSYCMMWSLRPYIDDETMQQAWKLIK
ncbi:hypothetical protein MLD38_028230 [Melastoma candidum]|uniref:Uncharacterized protein n=1 Tax=Melastoma candidum TaxID=119954 RepID=A0ACB9N243_9MYRT|nr:hypothetical protein MLD38_028230 [Melastoma candidum]